MAKTSELYRRLYDEIARIPVVDCHEHMMGPKGRPAYKEPIASLIHGYVSSDLASAGGIELGDREVMRLQNEDISTEEKWPVFEKLWNRTQHTAYAKVTKIVLKKLYGVDSLTRDSLNQVGEKLKHRTEKSYFAALDEARIQALIVDVLGWLDGDFKKYLDGSFTFPEKWKPVISLPWMHPTTMGRDTFDTFAALVDKDLTSLDSFLEIAHTIFKKCIERGAVGMKDQSAYNRIISYDPVPKADAERQFNRLLADANQRLGWPESKPLNDYLFHRYMDMAADLDMPVQIHTGHMAGIRNRIDKTNARHFTGVLEQHRNVKFDLFHGNWPYMGDYLYIGKNYPNVSLDLCWLHIIDPDYSVELLERATKVLPHAKIHGFGGDYFDVPEYAAAHLDIARENITVALTNLVESGWIVETEALDLAKAWLFDNPNKFFKLGLEA